MSATPSYSVLLILLLGSIVRFFVGSSCSLQERGLLPHDGFMPTELIAALLAILLLLPWPISLQSVSKWSRHGFDDRKGYPISMRFRTLLCFTASYRGVKLASHRRAAQLGGNIVEQIACTLTSQRGKAVARIPISFVSDMASSFRHRVRPVAYGGANCLVRSAGHCGRRR